MRVPPLPTTPPHRGVFFGGGVGRGLVFWGGGVGVSTLATDHSRHAVDVTGAFARDDGVTPPSASRMYRSLAESPRGVESRV